MKRFVIWIITVIITVLTLDIISGKLFDYYLKNHTLPGDYESIEKVLRHNDADLLILGSSVALNSINNKVLGDSLGINSFNGGGNGQTFPFFLTMLKASITKHTPKQVILCVQPSALTSEGLGNRYNIFAPYYGLNIADIDENLNNIKEHNNIFLKSSFYKLNTIWLRIFLYHFITPNLIGEDGHIAKPKPPVYPEKNDAYIEKISAERKNQLAEFLTLCRDNNIKVTILFTPEYVNYTNMNDKTNAINFVQDIAAKYDAAVYVDSQSEPFTTSPTLFYDNSHINIDGTKIYTDIVLSRLKYDK